MATQKDLKAFSKSLRDLDFSKLSNLPNLNNVGSAMQELEAASRENAVRRAKSEEATIRMSKQFDKLHDRLDKIETKQAVSDRINKRLTIAVIVIAALTFIATIAMPLLITGQ